MTNFTSFSKKQLLALNWWCDNSPYRNLDAIICDGAVRSGKTVCMSISFIFWSFKRFNTSSFALCGKTITSLRRNLITPLISTLSALGFNCDYKYSKGFMDVSIDALSNRFYFFGGKDEGSASLIQGMTLSGVFFDEVALMPRSFVEQALARCSVSGSKFWFNCNPEHPYHWFYCEWIKKSQSKNALYLHFTMNDNPSLSADIVKRYQALYSGSFFERFVLGKWVAVSGAVYPMFSIDKHVFSTPAPICSSFYISCDYGTVNPSSFGLWGECDGIWYRIREFYHSSRSSGIMKTDEEYYTHLCILADSLSIEAVIVDPSAASFIQCIRNHKKFRVVQAKNDVLFGIRMVSDALREGTIRFSSECIDSIREFSLYSWDSSKLSDSPIKNYDHAMDDIRYFVVNVLSKADNDFFSVGVTR